MKKTILPLIFAFIYTANFAQTFTENFDDGSFTDDPVWSGNTTEFIINAAGELQLNDDETAESYLSTPVSTQGETVWEFSFRFDFNPSSSNNLKVYLNSSAGNLGGSLNGYFVEIGKSDDALELNRQTGTSATAIITGTADALDTDPALARIRVTRDATGNWELLADYTGSTNFISEGTVFDDTYTGGNFFGFFCDYTSTRADKFFFDDININPIVVSPPEIQSITSISSTALDVYFSEPVALPSAGSPSNYTVSGIGSPANAQLDATDVTLVHLTGFTPPFSNGQTYTLTATGVEDLTGDASDDSEMFTFFMPEEIAPFDVLINEFLAADNNDLSTFQAAEYVELYNRSEKVIDLSSLRYSDGGTVSSLSGIMEPGSFVVLTDENDFPFFDPNLQLIDVTISLINSGDVILLTDSNGQIIDQKAYNSSEVERPLSTELVNPESFCTFDNWQICLAAAGGTPGMSNSVLAPFPDTTPPIPTCAKINPPDNVVLFFDELIDMNSAGNSMNYMVNNGIGAPSNATLNEEGHIVTLEFENTFEEGLSYEITVNNIVDCTGENEMIDASTLSFILPEIIEPFDVLINEFMAMPDNDLSGLQSVEYVELYNRSDKYFLLEQLRFSDDGGTSFNTLPECVPLPPGEYIILTNPGNESKVEGTNVYGFDLDLTNTGDDIWLQDFNGTTIHRKRFGPDEIAGAISTELINPESYCLSANWAISTDPLGGTPGRENSENNPSTDQSGPELLCVNVEDNNTLRLVFNEVLDAASALNTFNYDVNNIGSPLNAFFVNIDDEVILNFGVSFTESVVYEISVESIYDCTGGNVLAFETAQFAMNTVLPGDLIINEILYEAPTGGADFIEFYNNSEKILPINGLQILEQEPDTFRNANIEARCPLMPQEYIAFSSNPRGTRLNYPLTPNPGGIHYSKLPSFDDGSIAYILDPQQSPPGDTIDKFIVNEDYHNPLVDITKGVSLERIDFDAPTQDPNNWQSAAESAGWATPAYENSQRYTGTGGSSNDCVTIEKEIFSPDGDGYEDFLRIDYDLDTPGYIANVRIFDARGRQVKELVNNQFLEPQGFFRWNGDTDEGLKARLGIYIVWVELFDANGNVTRCKNTCVVAGQF